MYLNITDASQVKIGMKPKEVKKFMGTPNSIKKFKIKNKENWLYTNNVLIMIEDKKVVNIVDLKK